MKKILFLTLIGLTSLGLVACQEDLTCGEGTILEDGLCVQLTEDPVDDDNVIDDDNETICTESSKAYEVVNGEFLNAPTEPWFFIGGWMVNEPDSIWMPEFNAIIFDVTDAALNERAVWDGAFWQPKVYTEAGYTYTVSFRLRTDEVAGRDVILFLEDTDNDYRKFFEETVTLTQEYQTYSYEYTALVDNNDTKVGLFFANDVGTVIIDSILITREITEGSEPVCKELPLHEVVNGEFLNAPTEPWFFIGGWMVNEPDSIWMPEFNAIIFDVTDAALNERAVWDGAFWQPKIFTEAGYTYTVTFRLRTDEVAGRDVILFLEDTDNDYRKFFEETVTLTQEYQTFTFEYTALVDNDDTKVGLFFANDVGTVIIDSILITKEVTE
jgi:hypothetical protein